MKSLIAVITMFVLLVGFTSSAIAEPTPINPFLDDAMFYCQDEPLKNAEEECIKEQIIAAVYLGRCLTEIINPKEDGALKTILKELIGRCIRENTNEEGMTNYVKAAECFNECLDILYQKALEQKEKTKPKEFL